MWKKHQLCIAVGWLLPLTILALGTDNTFDTLDLNHDGLLDRLEFAKFSPKAAAAAAYSSPVFTWENLWHGFWKAFSSAVAMIVATEIGDKTFFIAAVLSMRHSRSAVFAGALVALYVMTILSTMMGLILPRLIPQSYTHVLGGILFLYFGGRLINDARAMEANRVSEELEEVEEELLHPKKDDDKQENDDADVEEAQPTHKKSPQKSTTAPPPPMKGWTAILLQSLTLTMIAEWGDRSQIATIALAAAKNPYGVTVGGCVGHTFCTGLAVLGGRMLAARISEKTVSQWGGVVFFIFGIHSLFFEK